MQDIYPRVVGQGENKNVGIAVRRRDPARGCKMGDPLPRHDPRLNDERLQSLPSSLRAGGDHTAPPRHHRPMDFFLIQCLNSVQYGLLFLVAFG